ncbi:chaperone Ric-8A [Ciona intestinalis]
MESLEIDEQSVVDALSLDDEEKICEALSLYNQNNKEKFALTSNNTAKRQVLAKRMLKKLLPSSETKYLSEALSVLLFLSRDRELVSKCLASADFTNYLLKHSKLNGATIATDTDGDAQLNLKVELLACKCLCNVLFITNDANETFTDHQFLKSVTEKIVEHQSRPDEHTVITLRLVFLITALSAKGRNLFIENHNARTVLVQFLEYKINQVNDTNREGKVFTLKQVEVVDEILKVLFHLNVDLRKSSMYSTQEVSDLDLTLSLCRTVLLSSCEDEKRTESLHCHAGNAIYSVPPQQLKMKILIGENTKQVQEESLKKTERFAPIKSLLQILEHRVMNNIITVDVLQPLLALLSQLSRCSADVRKALKAEILPPRKDFHRRPEDGDALSNKLVKLCTHANVEVKNGIADFLFVLCKENVDRFVKYTGYGNAAGLLAARGLLAGGFGETEYSDCDSDSDTEEYKNASHQINPVTGHVQPTQNNPMEGMSDEQKEYLAVKLAQEITQLSRLKAIQPMCVGEDGQLVSLTQKVHETQITEEQSD